MNLFKSKDKTIASPINGQVIPLSEVKDDVFSQAMMGPGVAIIPSDGLVVAPFDGSVKFVFPTKHALGLVSSAGIELLIHIGIDTVNLEGRPFTVLVKDNQKIKKGQALVQVDLDLLNQLKVDPTIVLVLTSPLKEAPEFIRPQIVVQGDAIIEFKTAEKPSSSKTRL